MRGILVLLFLSYWVANAQEYSKKVAPLMTEWGENLSPENMQTAYPRPSMVRKDWMTLNGVWEFHEGKFLPKNGVFEERILVPFPWESALSGIKRSFFDAIYRRTFTIPNSWEMDKLLLHFGAVDYACSVFINGHFVGQHTGGYDSFTFEISQFLKEGEQEICVFVHDPGNSESITYGKQNNDRFSNPQKYAYSPSSGIWQSVWIEPVSKNYIPAYHLVPNIDEEKITLTVDNIGEIDSIEVAIFEKGNIKKKVRALARIPVEIGLESPLLWSPDSPFLYDVTIRLIGQKQIHDEVKGYFGMRKISLIKKFGTARMALNNRFLYQFGPLDQGYWPDGIYTAPTDKALEWEVKKIKEWGFNMVRKHIKVEPERWYYYCDVYGLLVWQDMPSTFGRRTASEKILFENELQEMVKEKWNHPCIVNWVVFNEHWGAYDVKRLTEMTMQLDPSRLVTGNSGVDAGRPNLDYEVGHIKDNHSYRPPSVSLVSDSRATVNGEYGAIGYLVQDHVWDTDGPWVHFNYADKSAATKEYLHFIEMIVTDFQVKGSSGAVYTQWTDVENEMNGLYTYDRKVEKLDKQAVQTANQSTYSKDRMKSKWIEQVND